MVDIEDVLLSLAKSRPVFHSEADFQHALAWEIHRHLPQASVRLEYKPPEVTSRMYLDIWVALGTTRIAIELKYKTRKVKTVVGGEAFDLSNHGAQDLGRYDFLKDIQRLENVCAARRDTVGYTIMLTNDRFVLGSAKRIAND
jgi:hypothetical protein